MIELLLFLFTDVDTRMGNFHTVKQVLNYNGKNIGFLVSINKDDLISVYVPCYPSNIIKTRYIFKPIIMWYNIL